MLSIHSFLQHNKLYLQRCRMRTLRLRKDYSNDKSSKCAFKHLLAWCLLLPGKSIVKISIHTEIQPVHSSSVTDYGICSVFSPICFYKPFFFLKYKGFFFLLLQEKKKGKKMKRIKKELQLHGRNETILVSANSMHGTSWKKSVNRSSLSWQDWLQIRLLKDSFKNSVLIFTEEVQL